MADPRAVDAETRAREEVDRRQPERDWKAIERSPEFQELVRRRRSFVVPATIFFLAWYFGFIILTGYAQGFMASSVYEGLTVGYTLALTQFAMVLVLGIWYLRKSSREYDPLARKVVELAERGETRPSDGRFTRNGGDSNGHRRRSQDREVRR